MDEFLNRCRQRTGNFSKTLEWAENSQGWRDNKSIKKTYDFYKQNKEGEIFSYDKDAPDDLLVHKYISFLKV